METLEGHLKWIHELAPCIQQSAKPENESLERYCAKLLKGSKSADAFDRDWNEWSTILGEKMNKAAFAIFIGNTEKASLLLDELELLFGDNLKDVTAKQREVIHYLKDVLRWQNAGGVCRREEKQLDWKWADLTSFGENEVEATIFYFKGRLGHKLKIEVDKVKELHLKAYHLDPNCLAWCHHAYHSVRRCRMNLNWGNLKKPCEMESDLAVKAYQLGDNGHNVVAVAAADYGLMLKECLRSKDGLNDLDKCLECVQVLGKGLKYAEGFGRMKLGVYLAEFLYFGSGPQIDKTRGRGMLLNLEQEYPNSVSVLHKVGKMYFEEGKWESAGKCFKRAMEMDPTVMPCIMDYLKLLKRDLKCKRHYLRETAEGEIVRVLKKALSVAYVMGDNSTKTLQTELERVMEKTHKTEADLDNNWRR